jgi:anti-anti-sigma regulatory factor
MHKSIENRDTNLEWAGIAKDKSMHITVVQYQGRVLVALLRLAGKLDGASYLDLIASAKKLYTNGARHMIIDLAQVSHLSSAGLLAIHQVMVLLRGETPTDPEMGWAAFRALADDLDSGIQPRIKLLAPQFQVQQALERVGLTALVEIVADLDTAIAAFVPALASTKPRQRSTRYLRALNLAVRAPRPTPTPC